MVAQERGWKSRGCTEKARIGEDQGSWVGNWEEEEEVAGSARGLGEGVAWGGEGGAGGGGVGAEFGGPMGTLAVQGGIPRGGLGGSPDSL
ncbi:hypothetical protein chiPu_0030202 [Chiloscyllium punctatum]|uniref:Uncharacterized protein n=1 Tax=Chiloscyllium punctatum TaxID=137246 RepID=A0A401TTW6_CHIPU|nr:hypothetical protein [Chiloscyllium punctatum]